MTALYAVLLHLEGHAHEIAQRFHALLDQEIDLYSPNHRSHHRVHPTTGPS